MFARLDATSANLDTTTGESGLGLGERDPLEVGILACVSAWVEFGCTDAV